jgi:Calcineurin-like phosphoesterase
VAKRKKIVLVGFLLLLNLFLKAQTDSIRKAQDDTISQRIILIGDAGELTNGEHPVVDAVKRYIKLDNKTTILFLGDNLYKNGLPDKQFKSSYDAARAILDSQISIADGTAAKVYMIPGNHDWENGSRGGYDAVMREQLYVDFLGKGDTVTYYPKDGCPGPDVVQLGNNVIIIMFDSQWWLHPYEKPGIESDCKCKTKEELVDQIRDIVAQNAKKLIILACHHPFKSNGVHGGYFALKQHIFPFTDINPSLYIPLPILGSAYPIARSVFGTPQDLKHPVYANMIKDISEAVKAGSPNVIFVSGHDHNLQHIKDSSYNYIVSGGGCKQQRTSKSRKSLFNSTSHGFAVLEVSKNSNVSLSFYTVVDTVVRKAYDTSILNFKVPVLVVPEDSARVVEDPYAKYRDSFSISASEKYPPVKGLKKFFMGENYRAEWSTPVSMKVFKMGQEKGGFTNYSLGGGRETVSLRLVDKNKKEWVLRTVSKSQAGFLAENLPGTSARGITKELISATHPYSALVFPKLAESLHIPVASPELFFVPDDPAFGVYRKLFANQVCMLEERDASFDGKETRTTAKLFTKMFDENDHRPDQELVLQARLLDMITGDYDRHFDQWKWGTKPDTGKGRVYYPIPRDRDQAFFYSDGAVVKLLSNRLPYLKGFRHDIPRVNWLGYRARDFDRFFLTELDKQEWETAIDFVQKKLTDTVIETAVRQLPPEIYTISGEKIAGKMISRRNIIAKEAMDYYRFISKKVNVIGSNQKEFFKVTSLPNGLQVRVFARAKGNDTSYLLYDRVFDARVTKEIRLYGLNDDDYFQVDENVSSRIKLRIIGGRGYDTFDVKGHIEALLYDLKDSLNYIKPGSRAKNRFAPDSPVADRSIHGFEYNTIHYPLFTIGNNTDDGWLAGVGITARTYGFRNLPYASDHKLSGLWAMDRRAFKLTYEAELNHLTRNNDLLIYATTSSPALRNFYGFGNRTTINNSLPNDFYQTRYKFTQLDLLFRKRFYDKFHFIFGPTFQAYRARYEDNANNILGKSFQGAVDSADVFSKKAYIGGKLRLVLDNRNDKLFPTRGVEFRNELVLLKGLKDGSDGLATVSSDMAIYASLRSPAKLVMVLKFGGARILSKNYEFFQAVNLGANGDLYGFRKNRFNGKSSEYAGLEMRLKIADVNSYIVPGQLGIMGFYSLGRVHLDDIKAKAMHTAFGGGIYFIPFNLFIISATAGFTENEKVFNFSLGTKINLNY